MSVPWDFTSWDGDNLLDMNCASMDQLTIMQSTGLKDRHGKEMFESDLCEWTSEEGDVERYLIVWNDVLACYELKVIGRDISNSEIGSDIQVIGNVYENPDLLSKI